MPHWWALATWGWGQGLRGWSCSRQVRTLSHRQPGLRQGPAEWCEHGLPSQPGLGSSPGSAIYNLYVFGKIM